MGMNVMNYKITLFIETTPFSATKMALIVSKKEDVFGNHPLLSEKK